MLTQTWFSQSWQLGIAVLLALIGVVAGAGDRTFAQSQVVPDKTLGTESSVVKPNSEIRGSKGDRIDGGAIRGANLFHSFREFNVGEGRGVYFTNPQGIENILSRVTGANRSEILGRLGVLGNANLFLINPNGIVFGKNASLDIGGSFIGSTASSLKLADGTDFNTKNSQSTPLLTINVPIGLQFGSNAGSISIKGSNLEVNPGRSLALVGGNVSMDGGQIVAPSGHVELGGAKGENTVGLFPNGDFFGLNFAQGVSKADVSLTNQAEVNVLSSHGGSIAVNAGNLNMSRGSRLSTGISGIGLPKTQAGDITINATGIVTIADSSNIYNQVEQNAVGNSGNIDINADSLSLSNKSFIATSSNGQGNAGNITINTGSLSVIEYSLLAANAGGQGNAGNINIDAHDLILFDKGLAFTDIGENGKGQGGDFNITTESLSLKNGALLDASTKNKGDAGNIIIKTGLLSVYNNSVLAASANGQQGDAGNITIDARDTVSFDKGSRAYTDVTVKGNGGDINITTGSLFVTDNSLLASSTQGQGNAGDINIQARDLILFDRGWAYTDVGDNGKGEGGNFNITTESLSLTNGALLVASTKNQGNAGNIIIKTGLLSVSNNSYLAASANGQQGDAGKITIVARDRVLFDRVGQAYTNVTGRGKGGDISITTGSLSVLEGSYLAASANGQQGDAGNITIYARDRVLLDRAGQVYTNVTGRGNGGDISITTGSLSVLEGSSLTASANGQGNAGNIKIDARDTVSLGKRSQAYTDVIDATGSNITTAAEQSSGGAIEIEAGDIRLYGDSDITTNVGTGTGGGGDITLTANFIIAFGDSDILAFANGGKGGNITLDTPAFFGQNYKPRSTGTNPSTLDGNNRVDINASGVVSGVITLPDTSFIQNSLNELPENPIDTSSLIANSCIARNSRQPQGSFMITGSGGLPSRPGDALMSLYTFGNVRSVPNASPSANSARRPWQQGDPIVEAQGVYQLPSGQLVLSRECP